MNTKEYTNSLINETSPYLLQHAHNPVNWYPWGEQALEKAKAENKIILISVGYSACHWCHVMEHESFEDEEVAQLMNDNFVCIKVDREERPDIDQIYMNAVQLVSGSGGWPLNCFALPTGEPFYGGTYYPKERWKHVLKSIAEEYKTNPSKIQEYAAKLTEGVRKSDLIPKVEDDKPFSKEVLNAGIERVKKQFDMVEGGYDRSPKFPLPNNYQFYLQYYYHTKDTELLKQIELTLDKMAYGGIYDQIGGGFARYSTDYYWKVPHFEKMLYDNAQLVSLYSEAYQLTKKKLYKKVVYQSLKFVEREMLAKNGAFYSALDADSEGVEGKFYVWSKEELEQILKEDFELVKEYYNIKLNEKWEGEYILLRKEDSEEVAKKYNLTVEQLEDKIDKINRLLLKHREERIRPGLDDKTLTSWNALILKGYVDAYIAFGEEKFLKQAIKNAEFIISEQKRSDGGLNHNFKEGVSNIEGYLEDYSFTIEAFIALYQATFDESWLKEAKDLMEYSIDHFYDENTGLFYFTSNKAKELIARKMEMTDNVIPASNSSIAKSLFLLGKIYDDSTYLSKSDQMLKNVESKIAGYIPGYSNWGILMLNKTYPFYEIAITGKDAINKSKKMAAHYLPNNIIVGSTKKSNLSLLKNKEANGSTLIYVCSNKVCKKPVERVDEALSQIERD